MSDTAVKTPFLSNKNYDILKFIAQILLPALGTFYFAVASIWGLPKAEEVVGTIVAVDTLLGVLLGLSTKSYNNTDNPDGKYNGAMLMEQNEAGKVFTLDLNTSPQNLKLDDEVVLKIKPAESTNTPS